MTDPQWIYDDLGGMAEIATELGVNLDRVKSWVERRAETNCPQPVRVLRAGHIYSIADWRGWYAIWRLTRGSETWNNGQGRGPNRYG